MQRESYYFLCIVKLGSGLLKSCGSPNTLFWSFPLLPPSSHICFDTTFSNNIAGPRNVSKGLGGWGAAEGRWGGVKNIGVKVLITNQF